MTSVIEATLERDVTHEGAHMRSMKDQSIDDPFLHFVPVEVLPDVQNESDLIAWLERTIGELYTDEPHSIQIPAYLYEGPVDNRNRKGSEVVKPPEIPKED